MEALARQILRGGVNLYSLSKPELHRIAERLGRTPIGDHYPTSYLVDRVLSEVFSYADDGVDYPLTLPSNVRLANLITYYPDRDQAELKARVMNGELEPLCCQLTIAQLEAVSELLDIPVEYPPMIERDLLTVLTEQIRLATLRGGFDVEDEELALEGEVEWEVEGETMGSCGYGDQNGYENGQPSRYGFGTLNGFYELDDDGRSPTPFLL